MAARIRVGGAHVPGVLSAGRVSHGQLVFWDVHDESTKEFMIGFYTRLQAGLPKSKAMQATMQQLRESYPHPYYWAPFSLTGKG